MRPVQQEYTQRNAALFVAPSENQRPAQNPPPPMDGGQGKGGVFAWPPGRRLRRWLRSRRPSSSPPSAAAPGSGGCRSPMSTRWQPSRTTPRTSPSRRWRRPGQIRSGRCGGIGAPGAGEAAGFQAQTQHSPMCLRRTQGATLPYPSKCVVCWVKWGQLDFQGSMGLTCGHFFFSTPVGVPGEFQGGCWDTNCFIYFFLGGYPFAPGNQKEDRICSRPFLYAEV